MSCAFERASVRAGFRVQALVDGPSTVTGVHRQQINFKRLSLTPYVVKIGRDARLKSLAKAWAKEGVLAKWQKSSAAQRLARQQRRTQLSDFERFKTMVLRKKKAQILGPAVSKLKKAAQKK